MFRSTHKPDLLEQLAQRESGRTLDSLFYGSPEAYQFDINRVFTRQWLFAGYECEIKQSGEFLTFQVGPYPVLIIRGKDEEIRAFHNVCRHRGSRLCPQIRGKRARIVCPYHSWAYDLQGNLVAARDMAPDFDKTAHQLKSIACANFSGYIFICISESPPDISPIQEMAKLYLDRHNLKDAKLAYESTIVEKGDWKLVWENNRECYHCAANHPELSLSFSTAPAVAGIGGAEEDPDIIAHWQACEKAGLESQFRISDDGQFRFTRMPLVRGVESYTMNGKRAVRRPLSDDIDPNLNIGTLQFFHFPGCWNHILSDHALSFRVLPVGPGLTEVTTKWLVHKDAVEGLDYDVKELTEMWIATNDQDRHIVEENQIGIASPAYQPGSYSTIHESGVTQFLDWYTNAVRD